MIVLVDPYTSESEIPQEVLSVVSPPQRESMRGQEGGGAKHLDRWDVQTHTYKSEVAAKIGFLGSLFSGTDKQVSAGVIHEAKRYRLEKTPTNREIEVGVAVRLSVATSKLDTKLELSIPNLAAQAQLNMSDARIGISVVGYYGPIGDLLPAPQDLNVENFSLFITAARAIQARVFGPEGIDYFAPAALAYEQP